MTNRNAFKVVCKALALGGVFSVAVLMYGLHLVGVSTVAFLFGFSTALIIFALVVFGAMVTFSDEVKLGE